MADFSIGDLVVLKSGSMRMVVESTDGSNINVVWCHEGVIGRDSFDVRLLNKWEHREDHGGRGGDRDGGRGKPYGDRGKPYGRDDRDDRGGDRGGRGKPYGGDRDRDRDDDRPRKTGWDGKPRERKYYRKDD